MNPRSWYEATIGKSIDTDGYPRSNPFQCWDYFDAFCRKIGFTGSRYCASTGYVGDLWMLRDADGYNYSTMFEYIYDPQQFREGDWVFWQSHVALFMPPDAEVGQNQPYPYVTSKNMNWSGVLGAMRYRYWSTSTVDYGQSEITINNHKYKLERMTAKDEIVVLSAGINQVQPIEKIDGDLLISSKIGGANFYQMRTDLPDNPYGETYGDVSAPLNGVFRELPMQNSTLFYDLEDGTFGDCTDVHLNSSHNVFSPALVFPNSKGHWEYATMVGLGHKDVQSWYCMVIRFPDGYATCRALQELTPQQIADDFSETDMVNIAFLDGGGSAQAGFYHDGKMNYEGGDGRPLPSVVAIGREFKQPVETPPVQPVEPEPVTPEPVEPGTPEEPKPLPEVPTIEVDDKEDSMNDKPVTIIEQIAKLIDVKSIITFALIGTLCYLNITGKPVDQQFMTVVTAVVTFYFSYQVKKNGGKTDG